MTTFNNAMNSALNCVCLWEKKGILLEVTIIRDVYGKISFLMNNTESADDVAKENFNRILEQNMGPYYSGRIYWKKLSRSQKNIAEREKMIIGQNGVFRKISGFIQRKGPLLKKPGSIKVMGMNLCGRMKMRFQRMVRKWLLFIHLRAVWEGQQLWLVLL